MKNSLKTSQSTVKRAPSRGHYDRETINQILDATFLCHLSFVIDGRPMVIPTLYGRAGDKLYVHGSIKSRAMLSSEGQPVCICVTLLDGLVLARSAFHHSANYRSVVIYGNAVELNDPEEKNKALEVLTNQVLAGRWDEVRQPNSTELQATAVLAISLSEGSAKIRTGPPKDDAVDYELDIWAGVIPLNVTPSAPIPDEKMNVPYPIPDSVVNLLKNNT